MKMMRIIFLCSTLSLLFFTSCLEDIGNSQTFPTDNAVIRYYPDFPGITFLCTAYGAVAAPDLERSNYKQGDCLFVSFTIDYDNQPNSNYYSASKIKHEKIGKTSIVMLDAGSQNVADTINKLSVDSIKTVGFTGAMYCIDNNLFMAFDQIDAKIQNYDYQLVCSGSLNNEIPILYVCAKKSNISSATPFGDYRYQAFDLTPFLDQYAEDNIFSFYLQYKIGVNSDNKNVYLSLEEETPITLTNFRFSPN